MSGMRVSNSKIKTFRRCEKRYDYKYVQKLEPRQRSVQLERGLWIHTLLETHYDGDDWEARHKELSARFFQYDEEDREDLGDLPTECRRIMRSYLRYYKDVDQHQITVDTELDEIVTLPNGLELNVIIDRVYEDKRTGLLWAQDHKTRKKFENTENMLLDPQMTVYFRALEILGYTPLGGVEYNELRTKAPAVPEKLKSGQLSKRTNIDTDVFTYRMELKKHGLDEGPYMDILRHIARNQVDRFFRRIKLPKDPPMVNTMMAELVDTADEMQTAEARGTFPRTFIPQDCKWSCDYKDLCIAELHGGDIEPMIRLNFRRRKRGAE